MAPLKEILHWLERRRFSHSISDVIYYKGQPSKKKFNRKVNFFRLHFNSSFWKKCLLSDFLYVAVIRFHIRVWPLCSKMFFVSKLSAKAYSKPYSQNLFSANQKCRILRSNCEYLYDMVQWRVTNFIKRTKDDSPTKWGLNTIEQKYFPRNNSHL